MLRVTDIGDERFEQALNGMCEREQRLMRLRFGVADGNMHTLAEVAETFGVTKERVGQIEAKFVAHLRHPMPSPPDVA
jgi:RNA polymerase primary sigma factor